MGVAFPGAVFPQQIDRGASARAGAALDELEIFQPCPRLGNSWHTYSTWANCARPGGSGKDDAIRLVASGGEYKELQVEGGFVVVADERGENARLRICPGAALDEGVPDRHQLAIPLGFPKKLLFRLQRGRGWAFHGRYYGISRK